MKMKTEHYVTMAYLRRYGWAHMGDWRTVRVRYQSDGAYLRPQCDETFDPAEAGVWYLWVVAKALWDDPARGSVRLEFVADCRGGQPSEVHFIPGDLGQQYDMLGKFLIEVCRRPRNTCRDHTRPVYIR